MTYTSNIPKTGESLGSTRTRINANFNTIDSMLALNHVAFNSLGEGKHKFLQMPDQSSAPNTIANELALYSKSLSANSQLFMRSESAGSEYQITNVDDAYIAKFGELTLVINQYYTGWTFLPGGLIMNYGTIPAILNLSNDIVFARPFSTNVYSIQLTGKRTSSGNVTYTARDVTTTKFTFNTSDSGSTSTNIDFIAIGK